MFLVRRSLWPVCKDGLYLDITPDVNLTSRRECAIALVLKCIPEPDYAKIKKRAGTFCWFVPSSSGMAWIERTHRIRPGTKVIYLPAQLEEEDEDVVVGIVASALAALLLNRPLWRTQEEYSPDTAEEQVVAEWGFKNESMAFRNRDFSLFEDYVYSEPRERSPTGQFKGVWLW